MTLEQLTNNATIDMRLIDPADYIDDDGMVMPLWLAEYIDDHSDQYGREWTDWADIVMDAAMGIDLESKTRGELISWLCWNDPNGCYTDEECDAEGIPRLTVETAKTLIVDQINRN